MSTWDGAGAYVLLPLWAGCWTVVWAGRPTSGSMFWIGDWLLAITWFYLGENPCRIGPPLAKQFAEYPERASALRVLGVFDARSLPAQARFLLIGGAPFVGSVVFGMEPAKSLVLLFRCAAVGYFLGQFHQRPASNGRRCEQPGAVGLSLAKMQSVALSLC